MEVYFTPYKVSTITCNVDLGVNIDLIILYNNFTINEKSNFIWIHYPKITEGENKRGIYPKKKRNVKNTTKKTSFDNQVTVLYKADNYPNLKIFKNGNIQITGVKNKDDVNVIVSQVIDEINRIYKIDSKITATEDFESKIGFTNFHIRMINTDFKSFCNPEHTEKFIIRRKILHKILISNEYNNKCSFEPGKYHGVKLEFFWNKIKDHQDGICSCSENCFGKGSGNGKNDCKKITVAIFESGSVLITGGVSFEQINDAYEYITNIFKKHSVELKKADLSLLESPQNQL
jgi:TATA-box binding protein (TBP) (component of TFIID and TFIIIB)